MVDDRLPPASPVELLVARALTGLAAIGFLIAAAWELFGPLLNGHYASSASLGISAENMLRWHVAGPVLDYTSTPPGADQYYCHHPFGIFWFQLPFSALFGHHDFVCRLPAVLLSAATPCLLYATGRALWRPAAGAVAAVAFAVLPITLSFAPFNALEVPVTAWCLLAVWGYVRFTQTWSGRHLGIAIVGAVLALNADWPSFVLIGFLAAFGATLTPLRRPGWFEAVDHWRYARWWGSWLLAMLATAAFYWLVFKHLDKVSDLLGSYETRRGSNESPLREVLKLRSYWIDIMFTPIAITLGKLAVPIVIGRLVVLRREVEAVPLAWLAMAVVQYVVFKQGADIHIFWPHYFAGFFALGMGAIVATVAALLERRGWRAAWALTLGVTMLPLVAVLRDGIPGLIEAHETGGRFNEHGLLIDSDGAKTAFLRFIEPQLPRDAVVGLHESMKSTWAQEWALNGRPLAPRKATKDESDVYLIDTRFTPDRTQEELAQQSHIEAVGPYWRILRSEPAAPLDAFAIVESEPTPFERYFVSGTEPHREIVPDPFLTWELRTNLGQVATLPTEPPRSFDQKRIAYNIAVQTGDASRASALEAELMAGLTPVHARFENGTEILGTTYRGGAQSELTVLLKAGEPLDDGVRLVVRSRVVAPSRFSTVPADPDEREVNAPPIISLHRAHSGFLYAEVIPIRKRPGTEVFNATFGRLPRGRRRGVGEETAVKPAGGPRRLDGEGPVELLRLE